MDEIFSLLASGAKFKRKKNGDKPSNGEKSSNGRKSKIDMLDILDETLGTKGKSSADVSDDESVDDAVDSAKEQRPSNSTDEQNKKRFNSVEEVNAFRNRLQIKVNGESVPNPASTFREMKILPDLKPVILHNVEESDWKEPTPIQMQAIPALLSGRDILASAPTGSGKTAAFVIPVLSKLGVPKKGGVRALLLAPTKELAEQIHREAARLCTGRRIKIHLLRKPTAAAAANMKSTLSSVDLLIATPLRLLTLIRNELVDLSRVEIVVLDEADKLFELETSKSRASRAAHAGKRKSIYEDVEEEDEGHVKGAPHEDEDNDNGNNDGEDASASSFLRQIDEILSICPSSGIQRGLFSATLGPFVKELAAGFLKDPVTVTIGVENAGATTIDQKLVFVGREEGKLLAMRQLIQQGLRPPVLIFLQSKDRAKELFRELVFDGINVDVIHAERTEQQREEVIRRFRTGDIWVLICTDLMARGVDFKGVQMVINYDLPQSAVAYIHRIGRTGRAGKRGTAITFFTEADMPHLRPIANVIKLSGCEVPDWMLTMKQMTTKERKRLRTHAPKRRSISTDAHVHSRRDGDDHGNGAASGKKKKKKTKKSKDAK